MKDVYINSQVIGENKKPYIVAELSANHNGNLEQAIKTVQEAKKCGADAIKLQTYTPDTMTLNLDSEEFLIKGGLWDGYKLYDLYKEAHTPYDWHKTIFEYANQVNITCFSTPFDETAVDLLEDLNTPAYKIASFEATDLPLIKYTASTKKPMIMSTGMANLQEIEEMVQVARDGGCNQIILLHCVSSYPTPIEESNLLTIPDLKTKLGVLVGLSDHTLGNVAATVATSLGAVLIEKHFTLSRKLEGPDSSFSLEPNELTELIKLTDNAKLSLGIAGYERKKAEEKNIIFRRSLYFIQNMNKGEKITENSIRRIRPGYGASPKYFNFVIGKKLKHAVKKGDPVKLDILI